MEKLQNRVELLSNNIKLLYIPYKSAISYCGFAIKTGTRNELQNENGVAHFLEHMFFKGTKKRTSKQIINRLELVGGELDAYTTKEETFIYSSIPTKYAKRAIEVQADIIFNSTFPTKEINKERVVILDEIESYKDSPSELIYDDFDEIIFGDSSMGKPILGTIESVTNIDQNLLNSYYKRMYTSDNILFFYSGSLKFETVKKCCESLFPTIEKSTEAAGSIIPSYEPKRISAKKDTYQTHCLTGNRAYSLTDEKRLNLSLLNNILGGPIMSSRLNMAIREKRGLCYHVESTYNPYSDNGLFAIYFGCDNKNSKKCLSIIDTELAKLRDNKFTEKQLTQYKKQFSGLMLLSLENREQVLLSVAKTVLHNQPIIGYSNFVKRLESLTPDSLQETANEVFNPTQLSQLIFF